MTDVRTPGDGAVAAEAGSTEGVPRSSWSQLARYVGCSVAVLVIGWIWQTVALAKLGPGMPIEANYWLTPEGGRAHLWVVTLPWYGVTFSTACIAVVTAMRSFRAGRRLLALATWLWLLFAFVLFSIVAGYLDFVGGEPRFLI